MLSLRSPAEPVFTTGEANPNLRRVQADLLKGAGLTPLNIPAGENLANFDYPLLRPSPTGSRQGNIQRWLITKILTISPPPAGFRSKWGGSPALTSSLLYHVAWEVSIYFRANWYNFPTKARVDFGDYR